MIAVVPLVATLLLGTGDNSAAGTAKHSIDANALDSGASLAGTIWDSTVIDGAKIEHESYEFRRDGVLCHTNSAGKSYTNSHWLQLGEKLYMEFNNRYAECKAIVRGGTMDGVGWNGRGQKWNWHAKRR